MQAARGQAARVMRAIETLTRHTRMDFSRLTGLGGSFLRQNQKAVQSSRRQSDHIIGPPSRKFRTENSPNPLSTSMLVPFSVSVREGEIPLPLFELLPNNSPPSRSLLLHRGTHFCRLPITTFASAASPRPTPFHSAALIMAFARAARTP